MFQKGHKIGSATRFGPEWPGVRCGARTRKGSPCQRPARLAVGRCRVHGGASTGPRTEEGRARIAAAQATHGRLTKEKRAEAKRRAQVGREIRAELREAEAECIAAGLLGKDWRAQLDLRGRSDESDKKVSNLDGGDDYPPLQYQSFAGKLITPVTSVCGNTMSPLLR